MRISDWSSDVCSSDLDELAYAFYAANENDATPYDRRTYGRAYMKRAYTCYRAPPVRRAVAMVFKAAGLNPQGRAVGLAARAASGFIRLPGPMQAARRRASVPFEQGPEPRYPGTDGA